MDRSEKCETRNFPKCPFCEKEYQENKFCMTMDISGPIKQCKYGNHICDNCVSKVENCTSCKTGKKSRKFDTRLAQLEKLREVGHHFCVNCDSRMEKCQSCKFSCQNLERGCKVTLIWTDLQNHQVHECHHGLVQCLVTNCKENIIPLKDLTSHLDRY
jgi:hypothetical protein